MQTKQKALALIVGAANIDKAILSIKNRGAKLDESIQVAALSILAHADKHGDTTLADRLFNAMPKGARRLALAEWFLMFGRMVAIKDKALIKEGRVFQYDHARTTDMEGAEQKPWFECKKEATVAEVFDVQAAYNSLIKRITAAQKAGMKLEGEGLIEKLLAVQAVSPAATAEVQA